MKTAFSYWDDRIAPVFDVTRQLRVVKSDNGRIVKVTEVILENDLPLLKAINLAQIGVATLVCGAISRTLHEMILSNGIKVIPFIAGDLNEVVQAWQDGELEQDRFAMPGCCGRGRGSLRKACCNQGRGGSNEPGKRRRTR